MRAMVLFTASALLLWGEVAWSQPAPKNENKDEKGPPLTPAAESTRAKALKAKMSVNFTEKRLGDVLKEFAAQVNMNADLELMWAYGPDFPFAKKVSYACREKPLDVVLDELFKKNGDLGYIIVSKDQDKRDGWLFLTTTGERGALTEMQEAEAGKRLALAKNLIGAGKTDQAKTVLTSVTTRYPTARAAAEVKELLAKLEKAKLEK